jgi:hypothetical protein
LAGISAYVFLADEYKRSSATLLSAIDQVHQTSSNVIQPTNSSMLARRSHQENGPFKFKIGSIIQRSGPTSGFEGCQK